ncbi:hypothetical protein R1flu_025004 [Riccia fluitans]|uniref:Uncharacterized protein n=1 Tax=Riccia fluitans TaxID=41844 RepID=A0ABD1XWI9_9MARC
MPVLRAGSIGSGIGDSREPPRQPADPVASEEVGKGDAILAWSSRYVAQPSPRGYQRGPSTVYRPLIITLLRVSHARTDVVVYEVQPRLGHDPDVATPGYSTWCGRVYYTPSPRGGLPYGLMAEPTDDSGGSPPRGIPSGAGSLEVAGSASGHGGFDLHTDAEGTGPGGTRHATGGR